MVIGKRGEKTASLKQCFAYAIWISWPDLFKFMAPIPPSVKERLLTNGILFFQIEMKMKIHIIKAKLAGLNWFPTEILNSMGFFYYQS